MLRAAATATAAVATEMAVKVKAVAAMGSPEAPVMAVTEEATATVGPGDTIVLYTDGLVERRGENLDVGLNRLAGVAGRGAAGIAEELVTALVDVAFEVAGPADDVAVVAVRFAGPQCEAPAARER